MKLWVLAVWPRMPAWADAAWQDFAKRFPPDLRLELKEIKAQNRPGNTAESCRQAEATRREAALAKGCPVVGLA